MVGWRFPFSSQGEGGGVVVYFSLAERVAARHSAVQYSRLRHETELSVPVGKLHVLF